MQSNESVLPNIRILQHRQKGLLGFCGPHPTMLHLTCIFFDLTNIYGVLPNHPRSEKNHHKFYRNFRD